jgi:hypothetical protein
MKTETGPADYNPKVAKKNIAYSMVGVSKSQHSLAKTSLPGPGAYEDEHKKHYSKIPGAKMGRDVRKAEFLNTGSHGKPSASTYSLFGFVNDPKVGSASFSFGKFDRNQRPDPTKFSPGPGAYQELKPLSKGVPNYSMPGRRADLRPKTGKDVPAGGAYDPLHTQVHKSTSKFSVGK